jgi:hypothetical protein
MEVFCTYFGFEPHFTKSRKKTEKNMLKINLPQMSISCMALQKKKRSPHTGRWITFPCIKENHHDKN